MNDRTTGLLDECPHCGDTKMGYEYSIRCLDVRTGVWGTYSESAEVRAISWPTTVVCSACGRRVPREKVEKT